MSVLQSQFQILQNLSDTKLSFLAFRGYIVRKNYTRLKNSVECVADPQLTSSCSTSDFGCEEDW